MKSSPQFQMPRQVLVEMHESDSCDVIVQMEDGTLYTAMFVTLTYLSRQMELGHEVSRSLPDTAPVAFATLETPHVIVRDLERETLEDTVDNLIALDTFGSVFTQVTEDAPATPEPPRTAMRATAEVAAVVLSDVLVIR